MKGNFDKALRLVLRHEGGFVNHPDDPGGATNKGVTQNVYNGWRDRHSLPRQSVRLISDLEVSQIYRRQYWDAVRCDELPAGVDYLVFDAAVNSGPSRSVRWLQSALTATGVPTKVDGVLGEATLLACRRHNDHTDLIERACRIRMGFLKSLRHWPVFGRGWAARVTDVHKVATAWAESAPQQELGPPVPTPRTRTEDVARPSENMAASADAATAAGTVGTAISGTATQLEPIAQGNSTILMIFIGLTLLGVALTVGGVAMRWVYNQKKQRAAAAFDSVAEADFREIAHG
jgi:lysozyme family protein